MAKTKYTYKYNGQIVRNSNKLYKYGLVNHLDAIIACSGTEQGALKQKTWYLNHYKGHIEYCIKHAPDYTEYYKQELANTEKWHTVELEVIEN